MGHLSRGFGLIDDDSEDEELLLEGNWAEAIAYDIMVS
jgi:hypothetical protein